MLNPGSVPASAAVEEIVHAVNVRHVPGQAERVEVGGELQVALDFARRRWNGRPSDVR